jgi:hypothetical protein
MVWPHPISSPYMISSPYRSARIDKLSLYIKKSSTFVLVRENYITIPLYRASRVLDTELAGSNFF